MVKKVEETYPLAGGDCVGMTESAGDLPDIGALRNQERG
jgi:hypothetical protein